MKLTKLQRYTVYCIMLEEAENPSMLIDLYPIEAENQSMLIDPIEAKCRSTVENGLCWMYMLIFGNYDMYDHHKRMFPELNNQSPYFPDFGFNSWEERKEALKKCIELTHP